MAGEPLPLTAEEIIEKLARAADSIKPEPGMDGPHGGYLGPITRQTIEHLAACSYLRLREQSGGRDG